MDESERFAAEVRDSVRLLAADETMKRLSLDWMVTSGRHRYQYNFRWLGRPVIQYPQDLFALQQIIWEYRPDLVLETGVAHGGSLIFYASILEMIGAGRVLGIDVDIRAHNRNEIERHRMSSRISLLEGSSVDKGIVEEVRAAAAGMQRVLVILDSDHTHDHVLRELHLYSPMVRKGGYVVVMDTVIEDVPDDLCAGRHWGKGNSPKSALREFLRSNDRFVSDKEIHGMLQITAAPDGYLLCVKD